MKRFVVTMAASLVLVAWGGSNSIAGDKNTQMSRNTLVVENNTKSKPTSTDTNLIVQPITKVNSVIEGNLFEVATSALADGGYAVAWVQILPSTLPALGSTFRTYVQRFDKNGRQAGGESSFQATSPSNTSLSFPLPSLAFLSNGEIVLAYWVSRSVQGGSTEPEKMETGIFMQRFSSSGVQLMAETPVVSTLEVPNSNSRVYGSANVYAMSDGDYIVHWGYDDPTTTIQRFISLTQRYNASGTPLGAATVIGEERDKYTYLGGLIKPDAFGGYVVYHRRCLNPCQKPPAIEQSIVYYDDNQVSRTIVPLTYSQPVTLLPLERHRFMLFEDRYAPLFNPAILPSYVGTFSQLLNSDGNPIADPIRISSVPYRANMLADGSYVAISRSNSTGINTAQRFNANGISMADPLTVGGLGLLSSDALADGGFVTVWSGPTTSTNSERNVYSQRFTQIVDKKNAAKQANKKACQETSKSLKGRERKQFMDACLVQP